MPEHTIIKKANGLVEASYALSIAEQKLVINVLAQVKATEEVTDEVMYRVRVREIAGLPGISSDNSYREIKEAAIKLRETRVIIYKEPNASKKKQEIMHTSWFQTCTYEDGTGTVSVRFSKDILPYVANLKRNFTRFSLEEINRVTTRYGLRLYEFIVKELSAGDGAFEMSVTQFKSLMGIGALEVKIKGKKMQSVIHGSSYDRIDNLKRKVLEPAISDINQHTGLTVKWGQRKAGRSIVAFQFKCSRTGKDPVPKPKKNVEKILSEHARRGESREAATTRLQEEGLL